MSFTEAATDGVLNNTNEVTLVAAPSGSDRHVIKTIIVHNPNVSTVRFTLAVKNGANVRILQVMDLPSNNQFNWAKEPIVLDSSSKSLVGYLDISPTDQPTYYCAYAVSNNS